MALSSSTLRGEFFDNQSGISVFWDRRCLAGLSFSKCGAGLTLTGSKSSKWSTSVAFMDISILYEQAQRLLSGDIYRCFKSVISRNAGITKGKNSHSSDYEPFT